MKPLKNTNNDRRVNMARGESLPLFLPFLSVSLVWPFSKRPQKDCGGLHMCATFGTLSVVRCLWHYQFIVSYFRAISFLSGAFLKNESWFKKRKPFTAEPKTSEQWKKTFLSEAEYIATWSVQSLMGEPEPPDNLSQSEANTHTQP